MNQYARHEALRVVILFSLPGYWNVRYCAGGLLSRKPAIRDFKNFQENGKKEKKWVQVCS
jgi:hypothetical protein